MALKQSKRAHVPAFMVMEVMRLAARREQQKQAVYHLEVGQPGTAAPRKVIEAAKHALDSNRIGYTVALGIAELREAIASHYKNDYHVDVSADDIIITTGSSAGFLLSFLAAFDPGDRVVLAAPGYPCYRHILTMLGVEPVLLQTGPEDRYQLGLRLLKQAMGKGKLDGLILASPSNPSGTMLDDTEVKALVDFCHGHDIRLVSDEIYQGISYGRDFQTALSFTREALITNSFSKYFSMTGWRLGWLVMPGDLKRNIESMAQNLFISAPSLSQIAAVAAFDAKEELESNLNNYAKNREVLLNALPELGFDKLAPSQGAFYIYADISDMTDDSVTFCQNILNQTGVAVTPGVDFDPFNGHQTMRISFAAAHAEISGAIHALREWKGLADLKKMP